MPEVPDPEAPLTSSLGDWYGEWASRPGGRIFSVFVDDSEVLCPLAISLPTVPKQPDEGGTSIRGEMSLESNDEARLKLSVDSIDVPRAVITVYEVVLLRF